MADKPDREKPEASKGADALASARMEIQVQGSDLRSKLATECNLPGITIDAAAAKALCTRYEDGSSSVVVRDNKDNIISIHLGFPRFGRQQS